MKIIKYVDLQKVREEEENARKKNDVLGQEFTQMKVQNIQQQTMIDHLGVELTKAKLKMMEMSGVGGTSE